MLTQARATFAYGDLATMVNGGDCMHQRPGIVRSRFDCSPDTAYEESVSRAIVGTVAVPAP